MAYARTDRSHVTRFRLLDQRLRLGDRVRRCLALVAGDPHECADRRTAEGTARGHLLGDAGRDLDAMLDRVDPGEDRLQDPVGADRVRGDPPVPRMRLLDRGRELFGGERGERRPDPRREHPARRDELDREGAGADLLADGAADRVGAVDLSCDPDVVAMPSGDRERRTGRDHRGAGHDTRLDRPGELDDADAPEVPDGRDAVDEMLARVDRPLDRTRFDLLGDGHRRGGRRDPEQVVPASVAVPGPALPRLADGARADPAELDLRRRDV